MITHATRRMAWLWRGGAAGAGEEREAADRREENNAAMDTMRELCKDLLDPDTHGAAESAPANVRSDDDDGEREIVPAAKLEIPGEATLQRFLNGYELDAHVAAKRLRKMLKWRVSHSYGLEDTLVRDISESTPGVQHQIETGKCYILAQRDRKGRPIIVVHVRRHDPNTQTKDELSRFGVHILESAEGLLREHAVDTDASAAGLSSGVPEAGGSEESLEPDKLLIIFNLEAVGMSNIDLNAAKRIIYMLSNFYPERMGQCLLVSAPMLFSAAWAVIRPWLSRRTQTKIEFCKNHELGRWIAPSALPRFWGGLDETVYSGLDLKDA